MLRRFSYVFYLFLALEILARAVLNFTPFIDSFRVDQSDAWWYLFHHYSKIEKQNIPLDINAQGLRGARKYGYEHPADKVRILALGDSFTYGYHLKEDETWPYLLESYLGPHYEILNIGRNGISHKEMIGLLEDPGLKFHPDTCILGFVSSDIVRNILNFRQVTEKLDEQHKPILFYLLRLLYDEAYGIRASQASQQEATTAALDDILRILHENNIQPIFVYIPTPGELHLDHHPYYLLGEQLFPSYCDSRHLQCLDLTDSFNKALKMEKGLPIDGHWNKAGNEIIADNVKDYLLSFQKAGYGK